MKILIALLLAVFTTGSLAGSKCSLYNELMKRDLKKDEMASFMCIAHHSSKFNPRFHQNDYSHGIFQISSKSWCKGDKFPSTNTCNVDCKKLEDQNVADDIDCAIQIYKKQGFGAWNFYKKKCANKKLDKYLKVRCKTAKPQKPAPNVPQN